MFALLKFLIEVLGAIVYAGFIIPTPLSDLGTVRYRTVPIMTILLIVINSLVFMVVQAPNYYQSQALIQSPISSDQLQAIAMYNTYLAQIHTLGYRAIFVQQGLSIGAFSIFTSMFMHQNLEHLLFNMIYLWTVGRRVEDACGSLRFLVYYLASGIVALIGYQLFNTSHVDIPLIGASGAIAGVMGAYLVMFPGAMISCFWGIGIILRVPIVAILKLAGVKSVQGAPVWRWTIRLPAFLLLLFFLGNETLTSLLPFLQTQQNEIDGIAHSAHVAGFLAALLIFLYVRKDLLTRYFSGRRL